MYYTDQSVSRAFGCEVCPHSMTDSHGLHVFPMSAPLTVTTAHRRRRDPEVRPQQILDAAHEIFGERGLAAAWLDDIAKRAGVAKGTIYLYFATKEELFKAVVMREVVSGIETAEQAKRDWGQRSAEAFLRDFLRNYWTRTQTTASRRMVRIVMSELPKFPDLARFYGTEVIERAWKLVGEIIQIGIDRGEFTAVDPRLVTRVVASAFLMHAAWSDPASPAHHLIADLAPGDMRDDLIDFFIRALKGPTPSHAGLP